MNLSFAEFQARTSRAALSESPAQKGEAQPPLELPIPEGAETIPLPPAEELKFPAADLRGVIEERRTLRRYAMRPLKLEELAALLWLTQGVRRVTGRPVTLRTVPSAGARHAFETFILVNRVEGLASGIYRYLALEHALLPVAVEGDPALLLMEACHGQEHVLQSAVTFCWMAVGERMAFRYVERSLRYLYLDAGHVCQNLYLAAEAIGCGVCAIASFEDEAVNALIGADGSQHFAVYLASVGHR